MTPTARAAFWMIGSILSFSAMAIAGRNVSAELDTFEIMLFRSMIGFLIVVSFAALTGQIHRLALHHPGLHFTRNLAHFTGQNLWLYAVAVAPLAQVFALEFTTPIWAILLAPIILREKITQTGLISAALGFVGILIVARPDVTNLSPGLLPAALCAIAFGITALTTRRLTRTEPIIRILFYLTVFQVGFGLITAGYDGTIIMPSLSATPWVVLIAVTGITAHLCLTNALSLAPASIVTPIDFARLPLIAIVGMLLYQEAIDIWVFIGGLVIFGANYFNLSRNK
ncbi:DMT family transporter [Aestuariibius sp. HNIBRBA575]|uniref:DMT family transporter n=1 Tax=Aestuariibius sp. HNIBRBA575 TaxID=3233343 RepID=UPI0034A363A6